ncbi:MAG: Gmad2 immunoglobulin-like domain-containing protein [Patescibacteria group bacterium]
MKKVIFILLAVIAAVLVIKFQSTDPFRNDNIIVTAPVMGQKIDSPLSVTGAARGPWFFEASFPIELLDGGGAVISRGLGTAQAEWMTTDFVPFIANLTFPSQISGTVGKLILRKDNPSGLPEHDDSVTILVRF